MKKFLLKTCATMMLILSVLSDAAIFLLAPLINTVLWIIRKICGTTDESWGKAVLPCNPFKWFESSIDVDVKAWKFSIQNISKN